MTEATGAIYRPQHRHQNAERTYGVEAVGVCGETAHCVKRDRVAGNSFVFLTPRIGPGNWQYYFLIACCDAHFVGETMDSLCGDTGDFGGPFGCVILDAFLQ